MVDHYYVHGSLWPNHAVRVPDEDADLDDVLQISVEAMLDRRLQSQVYYKGFAPSMRAARNMIVQRQLDLKSNKSFIIEHDIFFKQFNFHKQKLLLHRSSMMFYFDYLKSKKYHIEYIENSNKLSDLDGLNPPLVRKDCRHVYYVWACKIDSKKINLSTERLYSK